VFVSPAYVLGHLNPVTPLSLTKPLGELFNGLPLVDALNKLRARLLDLSARNRLLNYIHPQRRSIQFVDEPDLDLVFTRLADGRPILTKLIKALKFWPTPPLGHKGFGKAKSGYSR